MSRIPTGGFTVPVPSAQISVPSGDALAGLGAGLSAAGEGLDRVAEFAARRAEKEREVADLERKASYFATVNTAMDEAEKQDDHAMVEPEFNAATKRWYDQNVKGLTGDDRRVFDSWFKLQQSAHMGRVTKIATKKLTARELVDFIQLQTEAMPDIVSAAENPNVQATMMSAIEDAAGRLSHLDSTGKAAFVQNFRAKVQSESMRWLAEHNPRRLLIDIEAGRFNLLTQEAIGTGRAMAQSKVANDTIGDFHSIAENDPWDAEAFIRDEGPDSGVSSQTIDVLSRQAQAMQREHDRATAMTAFDDARKMVNAAVSPTNPNFEPSQFAVMVDAAAEELMTLRGMQQSGTLFQNRAATADDVKLMLVRPHLIDVANAGQRDRFDAIAAMIPDSPEARIELADARATLDRVEADRMKASDGAERLMVDFRSGQIAPDSPNDPASLDKFYVGLKSRNVPFEAISLHMAERAANGMDLPGTFIKDMHAKFDPTDSRFDLEGGLAAHRLIHDASPATAGRIIKGLESSIASVAVSATSHLEPGTPEYQRRLTILSNPRAAALLGQAQAVIEGSRAAGTKPLDPLELLQDSAIPGLDSVQAVDSDVALAVVDAFAFHAADTAITTKATTVDEQVEVAARHRTAREVANQFADVQINGETHLIPRDLGLGVVNDASPTRAAFSWSVNRHLETHYPGGDVHPKPALAFRDKGVVYTPIVGDAGQPTAFIEFSPSTQRSRTIVASTSAVTDNAAIATVDADKFQRLSQTLSARAAGDDLLPHAHLRARGRGVMPEHIARGVADLAARNFRLIHGHAPDVTDKLQRDELNTIARRAASSLGWKSPRLAAPEPESAQ